jgi:PIN domain nuclease of toxin-antitoxin system
VRLLLDTHVWLWSLVAPEKLGRRVRAALERSASELWLSPISAWEVLVLAERGRIKLASSPRDWVVAALARTPAHEAAVNHEVALRSRDILPDHPDPADRFLVATALVYDLTLVTADAALVSARACPVLVNH